MRSALWVLAIALLTPVYAIANTLTMHDVQRVSITESEFVEISQILKSGLPPDIEQPTASTSKLIHDACVLKLQHAEIHSFDGISALTMSANVASAMRWPQDENVALQSTALEARELLITLMSERALADATMPACQGFADIQALRLRLIAAIDAGTDATSNIVQKLAAVRVQEGGHQDN